MNVSVILCHHRGDFVLKAIDTIKRSINVTPEIIVVTSEKGRVFANARTIYYEGGPATKRNIGAKIAHHDYLAFLDDDVEVTPHCLYWMIRTLQRPGIGMVYGKTYNMERRNMLDNAGSFMTWTGFLWARERHGIPDTGQFDKEENILAGKGASMMLKRSTFNLVEGFEEIYEILAEETDISWKVWFIGQRVVWCPKAVLYHAFNTKFKPWNYYYTPKRVYYNGCRNYIIMLCKFLEWPNLLRILPVHVTTWFLAGLGMFLVGKWEAGWNIWKGLAYHPFHIRDTLNRRKKAQSLRKIPDKELFKIICKSPSLLYYFDHFFHYLWTGRHG